MQKRVRLIVLLALFLCLIPAVVLVNRDTTRSQEDVLRKAAAEDRAFRETKMPAVVLPVGGAKEGYKKDYRFRTDWFSWSIPVWEHALADLKGKPGIQYLEVGLFEGRSALWMLDNVLTHPTSRLTGVDPFIDVPGVEGFKEIFFANLKRSGHADRATIVTGFSQIELRKLPVDAFDVIYIDGSHDADDVLEDAILSHRLLKKGGLLIFDDYLGGLESAAHERPKPAIDVFYAFFKDEYDVLHNGYQLLVRKKPADAAATTESATAPTAASHPSAP
jgi:hypothetical protein